LHRCLALIALFSLVAAGVPTAAELEAFFDAKIPDIMTDYLIQGVVVGAVTSAGTLVAPRSYGRAAADQIFCPASISKLFTATAAMQLIEAGHMSLTDEVETLVPGLDLQNPYSTPVTLQMLFQHSAGFDEKTEGMLVYDVDDAGIGANLDGLMDYCLTALPPILRPPGSIPSYSNDSLALLGCVVEAVAGVSFHQYVQDHVIVPMGFADTSFDPRSLDDSRFHLGFPPASAIPITRIPILRPYPAGSLYSTADDLMLFLRFAMGDGTFNGNQILSPASLAQMLNMSLRSPYAGDDRVPGMGLTYYEDRTYGTTTVGHDGDMPGASSRLVFYPEHDLGIFITGDSQYAAYLRALVTAELNEAFFPAAAVTTAETSVSPATAGNFVGLVHDVRSPHNTWMSPFLSLSSIAVLADSLGNVAVGSTIDQATAAGSLFVECEVGLLCLKTPAGTQTFLPYAEADNRAFLTTALASYEYLTSVLDGPAGFVAACLCAGLLVVLPCCLCCAVNVRFRRKPVAYTAVPAAMEEGEIAPMLPYHLPEPLARPFVTHWRHVAIAFAVALPVAFVVTLSAWGMALASSDPASGMPLYTFGLVDNYKSTGVIAAWAYALCDVCLLAAASIDMFVTHRLYFFIFALANGLLGLFPAVYFAHSHWM
jgi:CubicO group peptidase (beta-lactamase class C family)